MIPLGLMGPGEEAEILEVWSCQGGCHGGGHDHGHGHGHGHGCAEGKCVCRRVDDLGIRKGQTVRMLSNRGHGPVLLRLDESRIAIDRGMAMKIMVRIVNGIKGGNGGHETIDA